MKNKIQMLTKRKSIEFQILFGCEINNSMFIVISQMVWSYQKISQYTVFVCAYVQCDFYFFNNDLDRCYDQGQI